jgi:hypothetical protein
MSNDVAKTNDLVSHDGFDLYDEPDARLVQGTIAKFADGKWTIDGNPWPGTALVAVDCLRVIQRWKDQKPIEVIREPLPDLEQLNKSVPVQEWELDLNGQPRPPYQLYLAIYGLDLKSMARFTIINSTIGLRIAFGHLVDSVRMARRVRGNHVLAVFKLGSAPMKTRFGLKQRPDFPVIDFVQFGPEQLPADNGIKSIEAPKAAEIIDDIPF